MKKFSKLNLEYPTGCIIAKAKISDCVFIDKYMKKMLNKKDSLVYSGVCKDEEWIGYGFKIEDVEKIDPIYVNGKLGLWNYELKK